MTFEDSIYNLLFYDPHFNKEHKFIVTIYNNNIFTPVVPSIMTPNIIHKHKFELSCMYNNIVSIVIQ